jgi:hypothetical protein
MTQEFDPKRSYLTVKANEKMIAFVGFVIRLDESHDCIEGVVKISSFHRPYGGGYLTLTFMVDKGIDKTLENQLERVWNSLTEKSLRPYLGKTFERLVKVSLDSLKEVKGWYIEDINVYFRSIQGREKILIEEKLIPALEKNLPCTFKNIEWWPEGRQSADFSADEVETHNSLWELIKKWFGAS